VHQKRVDNGGQDIVGQRASGANSLGSQKVTRHFDLPFEYFGSIFWLLFCPSSFTLVFSLFFSIIFPPAYIV
jgi:hypothetical protein